MLLIYGSFSIISDIQNFPSYPCPNKFNICLKLTLPQNESLGLALINRRIHAQQRLRTFIHPPMYYIIKAENDEMNCFYLNVCVLNAETLKCYKGKLTYQRSSLIDPDWRPRVILLLDPHLQTYYLLHIEYASSNICN